MLIRAEKPEDIDVIEALTLAAFAPMEFSDNTEAQSLRMLRDDGDLTLSLVAEDLGEIVGHAAFSPVTIDGPQGLVEAEWYGLGPIAVRMDRQRQGIGRALIAAGLEALRVKGAAGCVLIGYPHVYRSSGFESDGLLTYREVEAEFVQRIVFAGAAPAGEIVFAPGLEA